MDDIFAKATRIKLRFSHEARGGDISVEDLWDLPLTSDRGRANLDSIATSLNSRIRAGETATSIFEPEKEADPSLQLAFDVVKFIGETKIAERKAANEERERAAKKQRIRELISEKKDDELKGKSAEDLETMLNSL